MSEKALTTDLMTAARQYPTGDPALINLLGALADEIERLSADAANERAEREHWQAEGQRLGRELERMLCYIATGDVPPPIVMHASTPDALYGADASDVDGKHGS